MPLEIVRAAEAELGADVYIGEAIFDKEEQTPADFYREYLDTGAMLGVEAIAIPLITVDRDSTPKDELLDSAVSLIGGFLAGQPEDMTVYLTVEDDDLGAFTDERFGTRFGGKFADLERFIALRTRPMNYNGASLPQMAGGYAAAPPNYAAAPSVGSAPQAAKHAAPERREKRRAGLFDVLRREKAKGTGREDAEENDAEALREDLIFEAELMSLPEDKELEERFRNRESTFQEHLFRLIDRKGLDDVEVYKKANIDRKLFSKIKSNPNYRPSKRTVLAFAVALNLSIDETRDLLLKAGFALTRSDKFDIIMEYCIDHGIYNINEINCVLFQYEQPLLGA